LLIELVDDEEVALSLAFSPLTDNAVGMPNTTELATPLE